MANPTGKNQYSGGKSDKQAARTAKKQAGWAAGDAARAAKKPKMSKALSAAHAKARATRSFFGT